jgi:branched-chain amino acid transport system substrate-binding protein
MVVTLALAIEAANATDTASINAKIRDVANPDGTKVYSFAEGKEALKKGPINYEGASSVLDFDQYGDVSPAFGVFFIEGGKLNRRYVVNI